MSVVTTEKRQINHCGGSSLVFGWNSNTVNQCIWATDSNHCLKEGEINEDWRRWLETLEYHLHSNINQYVHAPSKLIYWWEQLEPLLYDLGRNKRIESIKSLQAVNQDKNHHVGIKNDTECLTFPDSGLAVNHGGLWLSNPEPFPSSGDIWDS